jgi:hypothetical protein
MLGNGTPTPNILGRGCELAETGNRLRLVFSARDCVQQVQHLQNQPHISTRSQQFQTRASMLERHERAHDGTDTRRIQLRDIGQIDQYLAGSIVNQLSQLFVQGIIGAANRRFSLQVDYDDIGGMTERNLKAHSCTFRARRSNASISRRVLRVCIISPLVELNPALELFNFYIERNGQSWSNRMLDGRSVGGLFGWFWESPEVAARGEGGLSAGHSPQPGYSQLSNQIPVCTQCPTSAQGYGASGPLPSKRKTAA